MATNIMWTIYQGETGAVRTGTLIDENGPVDLSQYTSVSVVVAVNAQTTPVINAAAVINPDQETNKGKLSFTFLEAHAAIAPRTYLLLFKCVSGGVPTYYPLSRDLRQTYGRLVVQNALD
jgi:hypothetical protein